MNKNGIFQLRSLLDNFKACTIENLDKVKLLDRKETKFLFHQMYLPLVLKKLEPFYNILEFKNDRLSEYENTYYDTDDYIFYHQHHNGKGQRFKVRFRKYKSSDTLFFEIKIKNNKGRTVKKRLLHDEMKKGFCEEEEKLISEVTGIPVQLLTPKIDIKYS